MTILIYAVFIGFELEKLDRLTLQPEPRIETNHPHAAPELSVEPWQPWQPWQREQVIACEAFLICHARVSVSEALSVILSEVVFNIVFVAELGLRLRSVGIRPSCFFESHLFFQVLLSL